MFLASKSHCILKLVDLVHISAKLNQELESLLRSEGDSVEKWRLQVRISEVDVHLALRHKVATELSERVLGSVEKRSLAVKIELMRVKSFFDQLLDYIDGATRRLRLRALSSSKDEIVLPFVF